MGEHRLDGAWLHQILPNTYRPQAGFRTVFAFARVVQCQRRSATERAGSPCRLSAQHASCPELTQVSDLTSSGPDQEAVLPTKPATLSAAQARAIWLRAQRLDSAEPFGAGPAA